MKHLVVGIKLFVVLFLGFFCGIAGSAQAPQATPVKVLLLRPYALSSDPANKPLFWKSLEANWSIYGKVPLQIDTYVNGIAGSENRVTFENLEKYNASVIVLSNPVGAKNRDFDKDEIKALTDYLKNGRKLIGTFITFGSRPRLDEIQHNTEFIELFGFKRNFNFIGSNILDSPLLSRNNCPTLFPFKSWIASGWRWTVAPFSGTTNIYWTNALMESTKVIAESQNSTGIISVYSNGAYTAIYNSMFADYSNVREDFQLMYNSITFESCIP